MENDGDAAALAIIGGWEWEGWSGWDDHSEFGPITRSLSDAVNKLAFDGHPDAATAMLSLLADGRLVAAGRYRWRAYRNGHYRAEESGDIPARHWKALQAGLTSPRGSGWGVPKVKFYMLDGQDDDSEYPIAEWAWEHNRFSAVQPGDGKKLFEHGYSEEIFDAWDIEIRLALPQVVAPKATPLLEGPTIEANKGGAPRQYDWERAVAAIVFKWADEGSWRPASKADVKSKLADWFSTLDQHPSESLLKDRARWLFDEFQRRNGEADNLAA